MKKLMTVVSVAATLLAFGAVNGDVLTSTGFEEEGANPAYVAGQDLDTAKDDAGAVDGDLDFAATWVETELESGVAVISNWNGETIPASYDKPRGNNYLKLEGAPLITRYAQTGGQALDIGDGLYIDTLVQFTAAEDVQASGEGDKLCIWLKENEEDPTQCTLMVTAGFVKDYDGGISPTNYETTVKIANNSWHRLQVKALTAIDSDQEDDAALGDGFVVMIDGEVAATTECPFYDINDFTLNPRAARYMAENSYKLFPSLVALGGAGDGEITSLSFSGSGAVDNLSFSQAADIDPILIPQALEPVVKGVSFTYTGSEIEAVSYADDAYGYEFENESNLGTDVGEYTTTATPLYGYAWYDGTTVSKTYNWSIVSGGGSTGYDSGDGEHTFEIAAAKKTDLESALSTLSKTLTDTVPGSSTLTYAQAYALGLWDENDTEVAPLDATISVGADGKVTVTLANAPAEGYVVTCNIYEKASLTAEWPTEATATYAYGSETPFTPGSATTGFYKVEVVIRNGLQ